MMLIGKCSLNVEENPQLLNLTIEFTLTTKIFHDTLIYIFHTCHNMASLIPEDHVLFSLFTSYVYSESFFSDYTFHS